MLLTVVGNGFGIYAQAVLVAVGLGAIVERSATAYTAIRVAGALYLVYLGLHAIVTRRQAAARIWVGTSPKSTGRVLLEGFVVGVTNPKMIIFLTAAMPQFVDREAGNVAGQILVLSLVLVAVGGVLDRPGRWRRGHGWFAVATSGRDHECHRRDGDDRPRCELPVARSRHNLTSTV